MTGSALSPSLTERARRFGIIEYEHRLIHEARPAITPESIARVEQFCRGPVPDGLKNLWHASFGGTVDYDLEVQLGDAVVAFSFTEIFYPNSDGYRDFWGWIEFERELAEEAASQRGLSFDGRLSHVPFGGFSYSNRLYVCVEPGPHYGSVHGWAQGLPPAWVLNLNENRVGRIADDVPSLFRKLDLAKDPFTAATDDFFAGRELSAIIEEIEAEDAELSGALRGIVREALADWTAAIADGSVAAFPRLRRLAISDAVERDDRELLIKLRNLGCSLDEDLAPQANALDLALVLGKMGLAEFLLQSGVSAVNAVRNGAQTASPDLVRRLLELGARPSPVAARTAALKGLHDSAVLIAAALGPEQRAELVADLDPDKAQEKWKAIEMLRDACLAMDRKSQ